MHLIPVKNPSVEVLLTFIPKQRQWKKDWHLLHKNVGLWSPKQYNLKENKLGRAFTANVDKYKDYLQIKKQFSRKKRSQGHLRENETVKIF